ncbi:hypothetical protein O181_008986 [Austropuccinia psidii MF-1]|uniref:Secreted protein n=1 Tax=Austropuccinia psidii MF-1 TaxID=1389203 RepID=A0A9Q3GJ19_9BASI|nr:hypothetical protein [Austropuccinia psidii MF-1]
MRLSTFRFQLSAVAIAFIPSSNVVASSVQQCGDAFGPFGNVTSQLTCLTYGNVKYKCARESCHIGCRATPVTADTSLEKNFYFSHCQIADTSSQMVQLYPDKFTAHNRKGFVIVEEAHVMIGGGSIEYLTGQFNCTWTKSSPHNGQRPWCNECEPVSQNHLRKTSKRILQPS